MELSHGVPAVKIKDALDKHLKSVSSKKLLANPSMKWEHPALTTYEFNNHAVRSASWRYIWYYDGGEELYDEVKDPFEWTNLAAKPDKTKWPTPMDYEVGPRYFFNRYFFNRYFFKWLSGDHLVEQRIHNLGCHQLDAERRC